LAPPGIRSIRFFLQNSACGDSAGHVAGAFIFPDRAGRALFAGLGGNSILPLEKLHYVGGGADTGGRCHAAGGRLARAARNNLRQHWSNTLSRWAAVLTNVCGVAGSNCRGAKRSLLDVTHAAVNPHGRRKLRVPTDETRTIQYGPVFTAGLGLHQPCRGARLSARSRDGPLWHAGRDLRVERQPWREKFLTVLTCCFTQASLFDGSRARRGSTGVGLLPCAMASAVTWPKRLKNKWKRFAPGFRECIAGRSVMGPAEMERHNPNLIGGDIGGGAAY